MHMRFGTVRAFERVWLVGAAVALAVVTAAQAPATQQVPATQQPKTETNPDAWGMGAQTAPPPSQPVSTITTTTREVLVDVLVQDAKGRPVTGLKKEDLVVSEDGVPQTVRSFTEHGPGPAAMGTPGKLPPNTFTNYTPAPDDNASTVLLIDALDAGLPAQMYLHEQLIAYLQKAKPVSPIAIFLMDARMHLVQGFTTDTTVLLEAVKSKRSGPVVAPFYSGGGGEPGWMFKRDVRTAGMQMLGRYLAGFPGRKNVIWFTGYEPHKIIFNTAANNAFPDFGSISDAVAEQADALRLSKIAIYPVDAGGLRVAPRFGGETRGRPGLGGDSFEKNVAAEQQHFDEVAERTGGKAYVSDNGLKEIVGEVVENGSHYYTIAYAPTDRRWYGQYRHIEVRTAQPGMQLQYRHGYYARDVMKRDVNNLAKARIAMATGEFKVAGEGEPQQGEVALLMRAKLESLQASMTLGAIPPTELIFNASVAPRNAVEQKAKDDALPPDTYLRPAYRNKPYREDELLFAIDARTLRLTKSPDGIRHGEVEFVAVVYSDEGDVVNSLMTSAVLDLSDATYQKMMHDGFTMKQEIAVPVKGNYYLRLGVHDVAGDRVGAMEVPVAEIKPGVAGVGLAQVQ